MALGKVGAIRLGGNARDLGQDDVADAAASDAQALEASGHELMDQFGVPADPFDGVFESGTPLTRP